MTKIIRGLVLELKPDSAQKQLLDKHLNARRPEVIGAKREVNKVNVIDRLVYIDPRFAESLRQFIDFDKTFNYFFIQPLQNMTTALGYDLSKPIVDNILEDW